MVLAENVIRRANPKSASLVCICPYPKSVNMAWQVGWVSVLRDGLLLVNTKRRFTWRASRHSTKTLPGLTSP